MLLDEEASAVQYEGIDFLHQQRLIPRLIRAGADANGSRLCEGQHLTLHTADVANLTGALKALLDNGANPHVVDDSGMSALHYLARPVTRQNPRVIG